MAIQRVFLGWDRPSLSAAADYLLDRYGLPTSLDLSGAIVGVPGGRAGRRVEEILLERAEEAGVAFSPPALITVGQLPEKLYVAQRPFADRLTQQLAWVEALQATEERLLRELVTALPSADDLAGRLALGEMLARLHRELAGEGLDFRQVTECGAKLDDFPEQARWQALAVVQKTYLEILDSLELWDLQTARLFAIEHHECQTDCDVILVGTADLNLAQRQILDQVADRVTSLIFAPDALADRFDSHGCLAVAAWQDATVNLRDEQIEVVEGPADQAVAVARSLAQLKGRFTAEDISIGVPSEPLVPYVQQQLDQCGIAARYGAGRPTTRSAVVRLLAATADYLESASFASLAALLRHPALDDWLDSEGVAGDRLTELDRYRSRFLPAVVDGHWRGDAEEYGTLLAAFDAVEDLFGRTLRGSQTDPRGSARRPLSRWGEPILDYLMAVFGRRSLRRNEEPDRTHWMACDQVFRVLSANVALGRYGRLEPTVGAAEALRLVLRQLEGETIAPPPEADAIELLGWLELPLDDAPVLIVCGMNDQTIPDSLSADLFLPDRMRRQLAIEDNDRRYARDLYALSVLQASRRHLKLIAGKTSPTGDPLTPSRLLFAGDDETVARRALAYFDDDRTGDPPAVIHGALEAGQAKTLLAPPPPVPLERPLAAMRVTEFRDYLACPYRYYLKHRLQLAAMSDWGEELDAAGFGSLAHEVLAEFGISEVAASRYENEIAPFLSDALDRLARVFYGKEPLPAVRVQIEQLRYRLMQFARWQAEWARQGWRIEAVEQELQGHENALDVDGVELQLHGRIDRIDVNEATGERVVFDVKTSDSAKRPEQTHLKAGEWVDLQLPLYRHMILGEEGEGPVHVGYIVLPKDTAKIGPLMAPWSEDEFSAADRAAEDVVRRIRNGEFWPPKLPPPAFSEEFAAICQDGQFGALADLLREEEGDA